MDSCQLRVLTFNRSEREHMRKFLLIVCLLQVIVSGCGNNNKTQTPTPTPTQPVTVSVAPSTATVRTGATQQFTATVQNSGNTAVTWQVNGLAGGNSTVGTINSSGLYTAPAAVPNPATVTVTAVSQADATKSASATVTVSPAITVSVSPSTATVVTNATQQFTATVQNSSNTAVTWQVSGVAGGNSTVGTINASGLYTAPATVPSPATVTVTAVSQADTTKSASATVTITLSNNAKLNGQYAFLFSGFDATGSMAMAGSFTADGNGNITAGLRDVNRTTGVTASQSFTGTYGVGADNRGTITINPAIGPAETYAFALGTLDGSGVSAKARFIALNSSNTLGAGVLRKQDPAAFATSQIAGGYAFGQSGADILGTRFALAGRFTADGAGNITAGAFDSNTGGTLIANQSFAGTYSVASNGRGTAAINPGSGTLNYSFYVVSGSEVLMVSTDPQSTTVVVSSGAVLKQTGAGAFNNASLNGKAVLAASGTSGGSTSILLGIITPDGAGSFAFSGDENDGGTLSTQNPTGTYAVSPNGRVTTNTGGGGDPVLYLVAANQGFFVGGDTSVETGFFEPQAAGPFSVASSAGKYFFGTTTPQHPNVNDSSGVVTLDSSGNLSGSFDSNGPSGPNTGGITDTLTVDATTGRATTTGGSILYIISPSKAVLMESGADSSVQIVEK